MDADAGGKGRKEGGGIGGEARGSGKTAIVKRKRNPSTRLSARRRYQILFEVFNNHLLREKILEYVLLDGGSKQDANQMAACSLRRVNKTWNETVIKLLNKNEQPLFRLLAPGDRGKKLLARFRNTFASSTGINACVPPFRLHIDGLSQYKVNELSNFLTNCGAGLAQLNISINLDGHQFHSEFPTWSLDRLRKLEIVLELYRESSVDGSEVDANFANDFRETIGSCLLKSVLKDAKSLDCFTMNLIFDDTLASEVTLLNVSILESITLSPAITSLAMLGSPRNIDMENLALKAFPNLSVLELNCCRSVMADGLLFKILNNFRVSLKTLLIHEDTYFGQLPPRQVDSVSFPVMSQLGQLSIDSLNVELESGLVSLQSCFPKLHTLELHCQTEDMLWKWIGNSKYISVTTLEFYLADKNFDRSDFPNFVKSLNMETMLGVNLAFPNVTKLELRLSGRETSGLEYLFKEMTQLTSLKLRYDKEAPEVNADLWDSVLTGIPIESVAIFRDSPDSWEGKELKDEGVSVSLKNLKDLASLSLLHDNSGNVPHLFISDLTFRLALLQMPKLRKLCFCGRFKASAEMNQGWRDEGRVLEYTE